MVEEAYSTRTSRLGEHWRWRPDWRRDRACLWWYLTFEDAPAVRGLARGAQELLGRAPQLDVIPFAWLHLTLLEVGFADEVPPATVDRVVDTTRKALEDFPSFDLELGPVRSMPGAVVLQAHGDALDPLHERLTDAVLAARGAAAVGALRAFVPHVSVAYVNRDCDPHEVMGPLDGADLSSPSPSATAAATVTRVRLAAVTRERRHYQWNTRAVVPLGESQVPALVPATGREGES
jgi:2'-5' RNA ligase